MIDYLEADKISLVHSGQDYFNTVERLILQSEHTLHLQTYIFEADESGNRILSALMNAAKRGVKVFVLIDAFGSISFPSDKLIELQNAGAHCRLYSPLFSGESMLPWRRLHQKIMVSDDRKALIGGINIADKYNTVQGHAAWLDYAVLIEGNICYTLAHFCLQLFRKKKITPFHFNVEQKAKPESDLQIRFRRNDFIKRKNEIHRSYVEGIKQAKTSITIVASYFLPGANFRRLLRQASQRGVKIKIIMAGKSDSYSVKLAENYLYDFYIKNKIELYEWKESVLHGKVMLVDDNWTTIGSYNLNFLSHYISIELNTDIKNADFGSKLSAHFSQITQDYCTTYKLNESAVHNNFMKRFLMWLSYNFFRLVMTIFVSAKRKNRKK